MKKSKCFLMLFLGFFYFSSVAQNPFDGKEKITLVTALQEGDPIRIYIESPEYAQKW